MAQDGQTPKNNRAIGSLQLALTGVLGLVGCLTIAIIAVALVGGLLLDNAFQTRPLFTLILVIASVPLTIFIMVRVVLSMAPRIQTLPESAAANSSEEDREGGEHRAEEVSQNH
jgi:F0F1-type ATP synthase assembly protein I